MYAIRSYYGCPSVDGIVLALPPSSPPGLRDTYRGVAKVIAVGDVAGKGAPAALYGAFVAELVRRMTARRTFTPERYRVSGVLES